MAQTRRFKLASIAQWIEQLPSKQDFLRLSASNFSRNLRHLAAVPQVGANFYPIRFLAARPGLARLGRVSYGMVRSGTGFSTYSKFLWLGEVGPGVARTGLAWCGAAR